MNRRNNRVTDKIIQQLEDRIRTTATIINCISKEPAIKLIDKRFAKVIDWNIVDNNSSVNRQTKNTETFVKNRYSNKQPNTQPNAKVYNNQFINTAIIPNRYTSIKLPTIMDTEITAFMVINITINPIVKIRKLKYDINGKCKRGRAVDIGLLLKQPPTKAIR